MSEIKMYFLTLIHRWVLWHPDKGIIGQAKKKSDIVEKLKEYEAQHED